MIANADLRPIAHSLSRRIFAALLIVGCTTGCPGTTSSEPLTTADLERMAVSRVFHASVERVGGQSAVDLHNDPSGTWSRILRSLSPVISARAADDGDFDAEYIYMFQSGKNPVVFEIRVREERLCYRVGETDYQGGNAREFLDALNGLFRDER